MDRWTIIRVTSPYQAIVVEQAAPFASLQDMWDHYSDHYLHDDKEGTTIIVVNLTDGLMQAKRVQFQRILA